MTTNNIQSAYNLSKELISNQDHITALQVKIKGNKECIKSYLERNEVIMGELRVHTEEGNISDELPDRTVFVDGPAFEGEKVNTINTDNTADGLSQDDVY